MESDFKKWLGLKENLHTKNSNTKLFSEREIWWCSIGRNIGDEENGKNNLFERPVLIIKKFNQNLFWCIPLISQVKNGKYYYIITLFEQERSLVLSQLRILDSKRLSRKMSKVGEDKFNKIKEALKHLL